MYRACGCKYGKAQVVSFRREGTGISVAHASASDEKKDGEILHSGQNSGDFKRRRISFPYALYGGLGAIFVVLLFTWCTRRGWGNWVSYFFSVNVGATLFFIYDKLISPFSVLRIPELILHAFSLSGGSPAALVTQRIFRHKTRKPSFFLVQWGIFIVQLIILVFYIYFRR